MAETQGAEHDTMASAARTCDSSAEDIRNAISQMINQLSSLSWRGTGADAFHNAKLAVEADVKTISERLAAIANGIRSASGEMMRVDEEAKASLDKVAGGTATTGVDVSGNSVDIAAGLR